MTRTYIIFNGWGTRQFWSSLKLFGINYEKYYFQII